MGELASCLLIGNISASPAAAEKKKNKYSKRIFFFFKESKFLFFFGVVSGLGFRGGFSPSSNT